MTQASTFKSTPLRTHAIMKTFHDMKICCTDDQLFLKHKMGEQITET